MYSSLVPPELSNGREQLKIIQLVQQEELELLQLQVSSVQLRIQLVHSVLTKLVSYFRRNPDGMHHGRLRRSRTRLLQRLWRQECNLLIPTFETL